MSEGTNQRRRILSGMRPTGKLHLGNLVGALQNWVKLQDEYESYHFVADWHMLTTGYENTLSLRQDTWEMVADWLACGLDPHKATFFIQSRLPEHAELHLLFSMVTPLSWLERVPTYKEQLENITDRDLHTYGFLGYPLLQAADILMYKAHAVPVGEDQVPHVEFTREVARRFNLVFGELELPEGEDGDLASRAIAWATEARGIKFTAGEGIDIVSFLPAAFRQSTLASVSRAGLLLASNDRRLGGAVGSFHPARRGRAAVPGFEMAPCSRRIAGLPLRGPQAILGRPAAVRAKASLISAVVD